LSQSAWEQTIEAGHYDLRGDMEELKRYLAADFEPVGSEDAGETDDDLPGF
jgi:hypothetical protein